MSTSNPDGTQKRVKPTPHTGQAYGGGNSTTNGQRLTWFHCDPAKIADAVGHVAANGDAISFAEARNGTWLSVTILAGAERPRWTAYSPEEMDAFLVIIIEAAIARRD